MTSGVSIISTLSATLGSVRIPIYQVDAFASRLFTGNPAAVCPLEAWPDASLMQAIAAENNLAETAFFVPRGGAYELRWFTPGVEVDLCGHATLAAAVVILNYLDKQAEEVRFETRSGELRVRRAGELLAMDFPSRPPVRCAEVPELTAALGAPPLELWESRDYMALYESEEQILALRPDMGRLAAVGHSAAIVTASGREADFVSRFFAPASGVPEEPATGSSHSTLFPYWAGRLGKTKLRALQLSSRGGELMCEDRGDRVTIAGRGIAYLEGTITV